MKRPKSPAARTKQLEKLLGAARDAIHDDLSAAGWDEVRQHPTLKAHYRVLCRIDRALAEPPLPRSKPSKRIKKPKPTVL